MIIYTMGFAQKNAETFFELLLNNNIEALIDVRLNNKSQLAGFTKGSDLKYFFKKICNADYYHETEFAPTKEILDAYKSKQTTWIDYENAFVPLMKKREISKVFDHKYRKYKRVCLLCSEPTPEQCHRRLVAEMLAEKGDAIMHI